MPKLSIPDSQPAEVSRAITLLGNHVRVELIRALSSAGPAGSRELAQRVGVGLRQASEHLRQLESAGLVVARPIAGRRGQVRIEWAPESGCIEAVTAATFAYLRGR